ncbi:MAG: uracil-DNA glycosylase [Desulfurococcales archaeon]|nr:uracil-DNA glycosylase [Desulfurococcales archaeon]
MSEKEREWGKIVLSIKNCTACPLHKTRTHPVPGEGSLNAKVMFIGEAPGRREDETGRPFVGAAGKLLHELLSLAGLRREEVFITNVVKCRPPNNRDPTEEEVEACSKHTKKIIKLVDPEIIVTLGNHSGRYIVEVVGGGEWRGVTRSRGRPLELRIFGAVRKVLPTYHPAAALYNPRLRAKLEEDFRMLKKLITPQEKLSGKRRNLLDFLGKG